MTGRSCTLLLLGLFLLQTAYSNGNFASPKAHGIDFQLEESTNNEIAHTFIFNGTDHNRSYTGNQSYFVSNYENKMEVTELSSSGKSSGDSALTSRSKRFINPSVCTVCGTHRSAEQQHPVLPQVQVTLPQVGDCTTCGLLPSIGSLVIPQQRSPPVYTSRPPVYYHQPPRYTAHPPVYPALQPVPTHRTCNVCGRNHAGNR